jgi:hypothetical protein
LPQMLAPPSGPPPSARQSCASGLAYSKDRTAGQKFSAIFEGVK